MMPQSPIALKWLSLLVLEALAVLAVQVVVGFAANSLTLLADSAHSVADVIGYLINFLVERQKSMEADPAQERQFPAVSIDRDLLDLLGSGSSVALLLFSTVYTTLEAICRLEEGGRNVGQPLRQPYKFGGIGPALLTFAVFSTLANVGTLLIYKIWQKTAAPSLPPMLLSCLPDLEGTGEVQLSLLPVLPLPQGPPVPPAPGPPEPAAEEMPQKNSLPPKEMMEQVGRRHTTWTEGSVAVTPELPRDGESVPAAGRHANQQDAPQESLSANKRRGHSSAKFCSSFSGGGKLPASPKGDASSPLLGREPPESSPCNSESCCGQGSAWRSLVHQIVHPGCTESQDRSGALAAGDGSPSNTNLNLDSALLHLAADVLRGITILVGALVIESGCVPDPGKADAVCALFVASFVAFGSAELLRRLGLALRHRF